MSTSSTAGGRRTPRADCVAEASGDIVFEAVAAGAALVLRLTGGGGSGDEVRLPLTDAGDGTARAVLAAATELAEGRWEVLTASGEPVESGVRDLRALVDLVPEADRIAVRVPYPTAQGGLAVRCWVRAPHAEAGDIGLTPGQGTVSVEGLLYGASLGEGAVAEARLSSGGRVHEVPVTGQGRAFGFTLPYAPIAGSPGGKEQLWELWLRPAADAEGIRISRILDDVWDKKGIFVYPKQRTQSRLAAPCYTGDNDLCVRVTAAG
ncbi:hypothetical protein HW130_20565 [Streptomyces sp. PKU-EA00015]|uniref:hypothetical protein n=1 Tax=Streptomyces sp. PKU-EA00015 TaxID=2748326 RepID=UPI0015A00CDF|nr:hypothetical protein [Streptomyces sp. PKU-EA00015]NWF28629.1 hypothetical protein [Streptomyces sp. PKU-EA00015]